MTTVPGDTGGIAAALARVAERKAELNRLDDEYLAMIHRTEEALRALGIGLRLRKEMERDSVDEEHSRILVFDKLGGAWRLAILAGPLLDADGWTETPLASCDRETRFEVFECGVLEALVISAADTVDRAIDARTKQLAPSNQLVATIEAARPARTPKGGKP